MKGKLLFEETQYFKYTWSWWLIVLITPPTLGGIVYSFIQELDRSGGEMSEGAMTTLFALIGTSTLIGGVIWLLHVLHLIVKVDEGTLTFTFYPFVRTPRSLSKSDLRQLYVRKYNPISEYGGWGYRVRGRRGKAFNIKGNWGLQLVFPDGKQLLLGTQKPKELEQAIQQLKGNWGME